MVTFDTQWLDQAVWRDRMNGVREDGADHSGGAVTVARASSGRCDGAVADVLVRFGPPLAGAGHAAAPARRA